MSPIMCSSLDRSSDDPLVRQLQHFRQVIWREAALMGGPSGVTISSSLYSVFRYSMSAQRSASVSDCVKSWPALLLL